jgi:hypothetical protein
MGFHRLQHYTPLSCTVNLQLKASGQSHMQTDSVRQACCRSSATNCAGFAAATPATTRLASRCRTWMTQPTRLSSKGVHFPTWAQPHGHTKQQSSAHANRAAHRAERPTQHKPQNPTIAAHKAGRTCTPAHILRSSIAAPKAAYAETAYT